MILLDTMYKTPANHWYYRALPNGASESVYSTFTGKVAWVARTNVYIIRPLPLFSPSASLPLLPPISFTFHLSLFLS